MKELLMGNEAVALGAIAAGVQVVSGYPGTPSSEVLETIAKRNPGNIHVEWSVNEKAGAEVAAGAAYAGARSLVTMKQVGLNVASDPVMCVNYVGVKGGMVVYVADDPGPISSQTEQDTRHFAKYAHIPVFDCVSPLQAFHAVQEAFDFSEKHGTPVILRSTTRVCHACEDIEIPEIKSPAPCEGFIKDSRWVIFPKLSYNAKLRIAAREPEISEEFSHFTIKNGNPSGNSIEGTGSIGIACGGVSYSYVQEAITGNEDKFTILNITTPYPFPSSLAQEFMDEVDKVIVFEELDPVIEDELIYLTGFQYSENFIRGKRSGSVITGGELDSALVGAVIEAETGIPAVINHEEYSDKPDAPVRPPVLCAGCPHRASFYAVKQAVAQLKKEGASFTDAIYCGDIGCYTLGNAAPLFTTDTCLCMGAGITVAQGLNHADGSTLNFAFTGDSTFFASGITGTVNAVYNQADMILCVLDNSTTAMTGHQPHPGMGITMMGGRTEPIDIAKVLEGIGVSSIRQVDPLDYEASVNTVKAAAYESGVRAIIFKSPCIAIVSNDGPSTVDSKRCVGCRKCIDQLGCPALIMKDGKAFIDRSLCTGCQLCAQICPVGCIRKEAAND
ncbi:MAG: indolepyruvate ferredoxin oxidoreductase subunit alpha [Bacillota bacterium]|nr:indolepyruvate ferredoxin oxidoreductase subunit alpha [Bacillota bacterium]